MHNLFFLGMTSLEGFPALPIRSARSLGSTPPNQSVTYWYREFPVPGIPGTGNSRYRDFCFVLVVLEKLVTGKTSQNRYKKNLLPKKSLRTGIGKIGTGTKVLEPISEKFGTGK